MSFEVSLAIATYVIGFMMGYILQLILFVRDKSIVRLREGEVIVNQDILEKLEKRFGLAKKKNLDLEDDDDDV